MKVSKIAIETRKALIFLEITAGHRRPQATCVTAKNLRSENSGFIKLSKNESSNNV